MSDPLYKYPRLYLNASFSENASLPLDQAQNHYLKNVLRKTKGDVIRVFNGWDGEYLARLEELGKKAGLAVLTEKIKEQPESRPEVQLLFAPIKKQRMDVLIEKAVELGVSALQPIITNRTENRKTNAERMQAQIIEAAEQCERMDIPVLMPSIKFDALMAQNHDLPLYVALERCRDARTLSACDLSCGAAFLIGPEGGFDDAEREQLVANKAVQAIDLGDTILRAETAAMACLAYTKLC